MVMSSTLMDVRRTFHTGEKEGQCKEKFKLKLPCYHGVSEAAEVPVRSPFVFSVQCVAPSVAFGVHSSKNV